jgi:hypothetical protein
LTALAVESAGFEPRASRPWLLALLWLAATSSLFALVAHQPQRAWVPGAQTEVVLGGEHYRLDLAQVEWLEAFSKLHFSEGNLAAQQAVEQALEAGLEQAFDGVRGRLPAFADWYYSLRGEYTRFGMQALAWMNLGGEGFVAAKAAELLFPAEAWQGELAALDQGAMTALSVELGRNREGWLSAVSTRLGAYRVPAPLAAEDAAKRPAILQLDSFLGELAAREQAALGLRTGASTAAAAGSAATVWRAASARAAVSSGGRVAGRGLARAGSAAGGAATVCGPAGPAALGCAVLAAAVAWVVTDWALLKADEALNRDQFIAALEAGLNELRQEMLREMMAAYHAALVAHGEQVDAEINATFTPARAR